MSRLDDVIAEIKGEQTGKWDGKPEDIVPDVRRSVDIALNNVGLQPRPHRREVLVGIEEHWMLSAHSAAMGTYQYIALPTFGDRIPATAKIERCFHDPFRRRFVFIISDPSFEPVQDGKEPPWLTDSAGLEFKAFEIVGNKAIP